MYKYDVTINGVRPKRKEEWKGWEGRKSLSKQLDKKEGDRHGARLV